MNYFIRLLFALLFFTVSGSAQPYYFRHYQVENGLSHNSVFCSLQDKNGFLWFGTKDGLNRFDGYRFKLFNIIANNESSLSKNLITSLALDAKGVLWVGSQKGLHQFKAETERLIPFIDSLQYINDLLFDKNGRLWFTTGLTACRYDSKTKALKVFPPEDDFMATSICQTEDGTIWISTTNGLLQKFDEKTETFKKYNVFSHSPMAASLWIEKIVPGPKGTLFIGTSSQGIKQFDIAHGTYKDLLLYNRDRTAIYVRDIIQVKPDEFWFGTESGLFIFNSVSGKFTHLKKKYLDPYSLSDNAVYCLNRDAEGGVWAGTFFGGVNYYPKQNSVFQKYFPDYSDNSINGSAVREICEDQYGNIWIGTEDAGLNKLNTKTGSFTHLEPTGAPSNIAYSNIHGLLAVGNDLWVGTFEHGLDILDVRTGKVKKHYTAGIGKHQLKSNFIVSLLQTKGGEIYVGTSNSLHRYDKASDGFTLTKGIREGIFVSCLMEDSKGTVWAGTHNNGVFYFNTSTGVSGHFENVPFDKNSLTTNTINAIFEDSRNHLWFATEGGGLCRLDKKNQSFKRYTTKNGLPSNFVFKILEDNQQTLWVTTSKGLVNLTNDKVIVYTKANGLLNDQFNYNSGYKDGKGTLYFGSVKGMIRFKPDDLVHSRFTPSVYITGFQVHNKELEIASGSSALKQSTLITDRLTLPHKQTSFSIDFAAISFTSPEMTEYKYIMEGLDGGKWTFLKSNRKVYFTNLAPGSYTFKVKAGSNGIWSPQECRLAITILPPWWATIWAYLLYSIIAIIVLYYFIRFYHEKLEIKKEKEIYEAKIDFFTKVAHEIKTPLTLIKGPVENLAEIADDLPQIKEDVGMMERNTARLLKLINGILDFRQTETKSFSLDFIKLNIAEVLRESYLSFQPIAKKKRLCYTIDLAVNEVDIYADAEALQKIFCNLLSNAVKYAEKEVRIQLLPLTKSNSALVIQVQNDGYIIPEEMSERIFEPFYRLKATAKQKGTGIGLALARSLAELHKGKLYLTHTEKGWNTFVLHLPINGDYENGKTKMASYKSLLKIR